MGAWLLDLERRRAVKVAVALMIAGKPGRAEFVMQRSLRKQCRIAGLLPGAGGAVQAGRDAAPRGVAARTEALILTVWVGLVAAVFTVAAVLTGWAA